MSGRDAVLSAVRGALAGQPPVPVAEHAHRRVSEAGPAERLELFFARVSDYDVHVERLATAQLIALRAGERLAALGIGEVVVPPDLPEDWRPPGVRLIEDHAASARDLDRVPSAMTGAALAIAETGTVVLDGGPRQGRRALTLLPDHHLCVVFASQIVGNVPEAMAALRGAAERRQPITFFSGPSATADIEFDRVVGVHGPRKLDVFIVEEA